MSGPRISMINKEFGRLRVIAQTEANTSGTRGAWYLCQCQCGNTKTVRGTSLRKGQTKSCGCLRNEVTAERNRRTAEEKYDLTGRRYHNLTVLGGTEDRRAGSRVWKCICDCGEIHFVKTHDLIAKRVKSCGCIPSSTPDDLSGLRFGRLTVLELTGERKSNGGAVWHCICDCGDELPVSAGNLKRGTTVSCGCVRRKDLTGQRFGKLTVLRIGDRSNKGNGSYWICRCDCGNETQVHAAKLRSGHTTSCGCSHNDLIADLTGREFGRLTVIKDSGKRRPGSGGVIWLCQCTCGRKKEIRQDALLSESVISCGCRKSKGNEKTAGILTKANMEFKDEYSPPDMPGSNRFDFAVFEKEKLVYFIEYDGVLHEKCSNSGWDTPERLERTRTSDAKKNKYCLEKQIPLIRIPYTRYKELCLDDLRLETSAYIFTERNEQLT